MVRPHALIGLPTRPSLSLGLLRARAIRGPALQRAIQHRHLTVLAIETSCDDTCAAVLKTDGKNAQLVWHARVPCPNGKYKGIHPVEAVESHTRELPNLLYKALRSLGDHASRYVVTEESVKRAFPYPPARELARPDLIAVTRGPGMRACLSIGISAAKAMSTALRVPLIGVHHMQAHALTPMMESALSGGPGPQYPFLSLLVSGGHTMLVYTTSNVDHRVLASTSRGTVDPQEKASPIAIGDMLDKCAREVLPPSIVDEAQEPVVYAKLLESYVKDTTPQLRTAYRAPAKREDEIQIYNSTAGWSIPPPLRLSREMKYDFSGLGGMVRSIIQDKPDMQGDERAELGFHTMRLAFEHLGSRVIMALENDEELLANPPKHLVVSGGVASNKFLLRVLAGMLIVRGFSDIRVTAPSIKWCTDNAAMIAWTGAMMYQDGWKTQETFLPKGEWPIEQILSGTDCWSLSHPRSLKRRYAPGSPEPDSMSSWSNAVQASQNQSGPKVSSPVSSDIQSSKGDGAEASSEQRLQNLEQRLDELRDLRMQVEFEKILNEGPFRPPPGSARQPSPRAPRRRLPPADSDYRQPGHFKADPPRQFSPRTETQPQPRPFPSHWDPRISRSPEPRPSAEGRAPPSQPKEDHPLFELISAEGQLGGLWARKSTPKPTSTSASASTPTPTPKPKPSGGGSVPQSLDQPGPPSPPVTPAKPLAPPTKPLAPPVGERRPLRLRGNRSKMSPEWVGRLNRLNGAIPRPGSEGGEGGEEEGKEDKKPQMVRPLRPMQPEEVPGDVGSLRKGISALKKWAGF